MKKLLFLRNNMFRYLILILVMALPAKAEPLRILAMGDSVMAWHAWAGRDIPSVVAREAGAEVTSVAVSGAVFASRSGVGDIRSQFVPGSWDMVLINGGANDFRAACGCGQCEPYLDFLIGDDLRGLVPDYLATLRGTGAQVIWMGYYATGLPGPFNGCRAVLVEMEARLARLAKRDAGLQFVDAEDVIAPGQRDLFFIDRVHPSRKANALIGAYLASKLPQ